MTDKELLELAHTFGHDCTDALKENWREYL